MRNILGIVLAGGDGTRLYPLTREISKPAVSLWSNYRLIDPMITNLLHSGIRRIQVIVRSKPKSLITHLTGYSGVVGTRSGEFISVLPPASEHERFYLSDADSLTMNRDSFLDVSADFIVVCMADQVVRADFEPMIACLTAADADALMVYALTPIDQARRKLGVLSLENDGRVAGMQEKPENPEESKQASGKCCANLAMYVFRAKAFYDMLEAITRHYEPHSGLSVSGITWLIANRKVISFNLADCGLPGTPEQQSFFADAGTLDEYYRLQMNVARRASLFNLYSRDWPLYTAFDWPVSPARIDRAKINQILAGSDSIIQDDCEICCVVASIGTIVRLGSWVSNSVLLNNVVVGKECYLSKVVVGEGVHIPPGTTLTPTSPPPGTVSFAQKYAEIRSGNHTEGNPAVISQEGVLFIPSGYAFT